MYNDDVIVTSLKKCRFRKKNEKRQKIHAASTVASKFAGFKSS